MYKIIGTLLGGLFSSGLYYQFQIKPQIDLDKKIKSFSEFNEEAPCIKEEIKHNFEKSLERRMNIISKEDNHYQSRKLLKKWFEEKPEIRRVIYIQNRFASSPEIFKTSVENSIYSFPKFNIFGIYNPGSRYYNSLYEIENYVIKNKDKEIVILLEEVGIPNDESSKDLRKYMNKFITNLSHPNVRVVGMNFEGYPYGFLKGTEINFK